MYALCFDAPRPPRRSHAVVHLLRNISPYFCFKICIQNPKFQLVRDCLKYCPLVSLVHFSSLDNTLPLEHVNLFFYIKSFKVQNNSQKVVLPRQSFTSSVSQETTAKMYGTLRILTFV
jgi:hypothetical protein